MEQFQQKYGALVAKAWSDTAFKERLLKEPAKVFAEAGIQVPAGIELRVVEDTDKVIHLTLPTKPSDELSDEELDNVAGAGGRLPPGKFTQSCG